MAQQCEKPRRKGFSCTAPNSSQDAGEDLAGDGRLDKRSNVEAPGCQDRQRDARMIDAAYATRVSTHYRVATKFGIRQ